MIQSLWYTTYSTCCTTPKGVVYWYIVDAKREVTSIVKARS